MSEQRTWEQIVEEARSAGGPVVAPNGLPIACLRHDGAMLEHEHADHPTYMFPVMAEYAFAKPADVPEWDDSYEPTTHALIYHDRTVALTLYECCYDLWHLGNGRHMGGSPWFEHWRLSDQARRKIAETRNAP